MFSVHNLFSGQIDTGELCRNFNAEAVKMQFVQTRYIISSLLIIRRESLKTSTSNLFSRNSEY